MTGDCNASNHKSFIKFKPPNSLLPTETKKPSHGERAIKMEWGELYLKILQKDIWITKQKIKLILEKGAVVVLFHLTRDILLN